MDVTTIPGSYEIKMCTSCQLDKCNESNSACMRMSRGGEMAYRAYELICHHPLTDNELSKKMSLNKVDTSWILKRLERAKLIKQKDGEWVRK